jgi:hypothetical protein
MSVMETKVRELAERCSRAVIDALRTMRVGELAALVMPSRTRASTRVRSSLPASRSRTRAATSTKVRTSQKKASARVGQVIKRKDGRTFTRTAKAMAAHKLQGQYIGHLGRVPAKEKERFRDIAHEQGVAAAVAALMKRLGKA